MSLPDITIKFNIITILAAVFLGALGIAAIGICFINKNKILETFENVINNTVNYDPYGPLKNNTGGSVPLPENELNFFYNNKFDPSCCSQPQQYSSSTGCACITKEQMQYLNKRGGNNTFCSEF